MSDPRYEAFAAALAELYKRYPLPDYKHSRHRYKRERDRTLAVEYAALGANLEVVTLFAFGVPEKELKSVYILIYG